MYQSGLRKVSMSAPSSFSVLLSTPVTHSHFCVCQKNVPLPSKKNMPLNPVSRCANLNPGSRGDGIDMAVRSHQYVSRKSCIRICFKITILWRTVPLIICGIFELWLVPTSGCAHVRADAANFSSELTLTRATHLNRSAGTGSYSTRSLWTGKIISGCGKGH